MFKNLFNFLNNLYVQLSFYAAYNNDRENLFKIKIFTLRASW